MGPKVRQRLIIIICYTELILVIIYRRFTGLTTLCPRLLLVLPFQPIYRLGHPEHYLFLL